MHRGCFVHFHKPHKCLVLFKKNQLTNKQMFYSKRNLCLMLFLCCSSHQPGLILNFLWGIERNCGLNTVTSGFSLPVTFKSCYPPITQHGTVLINKLLSLNQMKDLVTVRLRSTLPNTQQCTLIQRLNVFIEKIKYTAQEVTLYWKPPFYLRFFFLNFS